MMLSLKLPLFTGFMDQPRNDYPEIFPFELYYDNTLEMFRQSNTDELDQLLTKLYSSGSMLDGEINDSDGQLQAKAGIAIIDEVMPKVAGRRVLEIGCGSGFILSHLATKGAVCTGVEPGSQIKAITDPNITKIHDFFPSPSLNGSFDLIYSFNVLEHIVDPIRSLWHQLQLLNDGGYVVVGVPSCEFSMQHGDISVFTHEHYNYFTKKSIEKIARIFDMQLTRLIEGAMGGMLFFAFQKTTGSYPVGEPVEVALTNDPTEVFKDKINSATKKLMDIISDSSHNKIAIYVPSRAMNLLSNCSITDCRLIDDKPSIKGKYLPGFHSKIEDFSDLIISPPEKIIVFSNTFSQAIVEKIRRTRMLDNVEVFTLDRDIIM